MKLKAFFLTLAFALAVMATASNAQTNQTDKAETQEQHDARMAWWRDAKFGLFIHWGVYSVPAGFYHDQPVKSLSLIHI